jgi:uncharacterized membrane protein
MKLAAFIGAGLFFAIATITNIILTTVLKTDPRAELVIHTITGFFAGAIYATYLILILKKEEKQEEKKWKRIY